MVGEIINLLIIYFVYFQRVTQSNPPEVELMIVCVKISNFSVLINCPLCVLIIKDIEFISSKNFFENLKTAKCYISLSVRRKFVCIFYVYI